MILIKKRFQTQFPKTKVQTFFLLRVLSRKKTTNAMIKSPKSKTMQERVGNLAERL